MVKTYKLHCDLSKPLSIEDLMNDLNIRDKIFYIRCNYCGEFVNNKRVDQHSISKCFNKQEYRNEKQGGLIIKTKSMLHDFYGSNVYESLRFGGRDLTKNDFKKWTFFQQI